RFFSSRRRHTRFSRDWSSDVCSSDLVSLKGQKLSIKVRRMKYEIPRESFKQRLENRLNFVFVDLQAGSSANFENVEKMNYGPSRSEERRVGKEGGTASGTDMCPNKTI